MLNLQVTLVPWGKQGPVRLTMVPPSMFPFSGANTSGRFVPTETFAVTSCDAVHRLLTEVPDADPGHDLLVDSEDVAAGEPVSKAGAGQVSYLGPLQYSGVQYSKLI